MAAAFGAAALAVFAAAPVEAQLLETFSKTVKDGGAAAVQGYLDAGGNPNATEGERDLTLLHWAAFYGKADVVKLLVDRGAVVDAHAKNPDWRPLHYASWFGHKDAIAYLLDHGAAIDGLTSDGLSPLEAVANYSSTEGNYSEETRLAKVATIPLLLSRGADAGYALVRLAGKGQTESIALLLDNGAFVNATPRTEHLEFGAELGGTALFRAVQYGDLAPIDLLLARGADPNMMSQKSVNMPTPLMTAAYYCDGEIIDRLLAHGANRYATNSSGDTAAMLAESGWTTDMRPCSADVTAKLR
jgi:ankyrin repeat protein